MTTESETTSLQFLEIEQRCKEANIEVKLSKTEDNTDKLTVLLQAGKVKREILVRNEQSAKALLSLPFEKIRGISSYRAFWSHEDGFIEAILDSGRLTSLPPFLTLRRLQKAFQSSTTIIEEPQEIEDDSQTEIDSADSRITINSDDERFQGTRLSIGLATQTISVLETLRLRGRLRLGERDRLSRPMTIRIEGVSLSYHDQAVNILEKIANSFLFQVDLLIGLPMYLAIEEDREIRVRRASAGREETRLTFPKYQYDSKAMSLYWYASTARGIPLLQYLAYYQVIEFYFPIFAEKEAHEQIKRLLKNPSFDENRDMDISQLIGAIKPFIKGGYGEERSALLATIKNCVSEIEFKDFFQEDSQRLEFFKSKSQVAEQKISLESGKADILNETVNRIYEIRCKIVHTKSIETGGKSELLLPFSKEAQQLRFDIELVQFVARKVLIASSRSLTI